jgi:hypothetical protein
MPEVQKTPRFANTIKTLSIDSPLKIDRQPIKAESDTTGLLLSTNRVYVENEPLSEKEVATKKYVDNSVDNLVQSGAVIGYSRIANDSTSAPDNSISLTSSMTVLQTAQGTDVKVTFTAPSSGNIEIVFSCRLYTSSTTVGFALSDNSTYNEVHETHTYDAGIYKMDETDINFINIAWAVTGLTSGQSYTYYIAGEETSGSTSTIAHGRFRTAETHYTPILVKAIALPDTIFTGE